MFECFRTRTPALFGMDIGSSAIKLLQLSRRDSRYRVERYASQALPPGAVVEKHIRDIAAVGAGIRQLLSDAGGGTRRAVVAVPGSAVITRRIALPAGLTEAELESQLVVEADQHIPFPLDEVAIDFAPLPPAAPGVGGNRGGNADSIDVLLAACKKDNVDLRVAALEAGACQAAVVDIETQAVERAFRLLCGQMGLGHDGAVAIVDLGATLSTLHVLRDGQSIYVRELGFGGARLARAVQQRCNLAPAAAVAALSATAGDLPAVCKQELLPSFRAQVCEQLNRALRFFLSSSGYPAVDLIVLAGGPATTAGLAAQLEQALAITTVVASPFADMTVGRGVNRSQLERDGAALLLASGLALRGCGGG